jgi:PAS domain S-box-containing protein
MGERAVTKQATEVLLVEDETAHAELIRRAFEPYAGQFRLHVVRGVREALAYLTAAVPDLAIVDWLLPDGSGLELVAPAGATGRYPVILMTSHGSEQVAVQAMRAGVVDYVVKSESTLTDMPHIVERALRSWEHIVERQRAEAALRQSEERYRDLFENANDIVYTHDLQGDFTSINRTAERMTGYSRDEALGMNFRDIVAPEYQALAQRMAASSLAGAPVTAYELGIVTKTGQRLLLEVSPRLMLQEGQPIGIQGIARDITERKRLEAELRQAQKMQAIGTMAGGIAHDFNNILTALLGYTELAIYDVLPTDTVWQHLQEVLKAGQRAKALVQQILTFSRQTAQTRMPVQLPHLVQDALGLLRASLPSTIEIRSAISSEAGTVLADPTQLHQVLLNLCTNAEYAMRQTGGVLEIRLEAVHVEAAETASPLGLQPGRYVRLLVGDTGHGMAPEVVERIFEPFFTTKGPGEGTGMGLAMVHGIVTSHGGMVTVTSAVGQGATFAVYLPCISEPAWQDIPPEAGLPTGCGRVLLVDDEEMLRHLGQELLTRLGYDVAAYSNSVEALEAFRRAPQGFDLVITDQTMPHLTGAHLVQEMRRIRPDIPIILCTGYSHVMNAERARALGVNAFLMKPIEMRDLAHAIQQVLTQRPEPMS